MLTILASGGAVLALAALTAAGMVLPPFLGDFFLARVIQVLVPLYLLVCFLLHGRRNVQGWERFAGVRYAHRGLHREPDVPENSLAAFRRAAAAGYGAELDVHLTADGRLAVVHDSQLFRVCGKHGVVEQLTARELEAYRLGGTEEKIPFLEQVLEIFQGRTPLIVELKPAGGNHARLTAAAVACLDRYRVDCCVESFDPRVLVWLRENRPELVRGQLSQSFWRHPEGQGIWRRLALTSLFFNAVARPDFVAYRFEDRRSPALRLCRRMGVRMAYWTICTPQALAQTEAEGALPIFENFDPKEEHSA